nr:neuroligin-3 [Aedes albopictus]
MPPVTPSTWKTTKLANNFSPVCPQALPKLYGSDGLFEHTRGRLAHLRRLLPLLSNQSEDCLYLNLYVPRSGESVEPDGTTKATIVYIHGESYEWNSGNPYDGSILASTGNVILVTINFRLGVLGFLKTGAKGSAQGNFGLMDLVAALHWLRENLSAFHGDPSRITLMGHGTGASLANILVVSPVASDLIHRVILLSGSALSPWAIQRDPLAIKQIVANQTRCKLDLLMDDLAPCLRTKSVSELLRIIPPNPRFLPGYAPFVDGTVIINPRTANIRLPTLPLGSAITSTNGIEFANFPTAELLFGLTSYESYNDLSAQDMEFGFNETRRDRILRTYVRNVFHFHLKEIYSTLRNEYTDWEHPPRNPLGHRDTILELLSDGHTAAPLVRLGYLHSLQEGKSYFLHFRHQSDERDFPQRGGSVRGEDVPFTFGLPLSPLFSSNYSLEDKQISQILMRYLTNFAKTGMPNGLNTQNVNDISQDDHGSTRNMHNGKNHHRYKRSNFKFPFRDEQIPPGFLNNKLLKSLYQININTSYFDNDSNEEFNSNKDNDSWGDAINTLADDPEEIDVMHDSPGYGRRESYDENDSDDNDSYDSMNRETLLNLEKWDMYDSINQIYLELGKSGCSATARSHYRGHKLSMWLSLIPQLHSFDDAAYLPMRHHHFTDDKPEYYDGRLKESRNITLPRLITIAKTTTKPHKTETNAVPFAQTIPTECPPNMTVMPPIAATYPQRNQMGTADNSKELINQLANSQYQNYSTAFNITIGVGCFLLLLNVIIFSAIYYQREKHANLNKQKDNSLSEDSLHEGISTAESRFEQQNVMRNSENDSIGSKSNLKLQSVSGVASLNEYNCYEQGPDSKKKCIIVDVCSSELPLKEYPYTSPRGSTTGSIRCSVTPETYKKLSLENLAAVPQAYSSQPSSMSDSSSLTVSTYHPMRQNASTITGDQCTQSEQTCLPETQEIGTTVNEVDLEYSSMMMETSQINRSAGFQGGILRQQTGSVIHGTAKKRVQIQEISV